MLLLVYLYNENWLICICCRVCTVSRCYRAEKTNASGEEGIYRVHHFTKVVRNKIYVLQLLLAYSLLYQSFTRVNLV